MVNHNVLGDIHWEVLLRTTFVGDMSYLLESTHGRLNLCHTCQHILKAMAPRVAARHQHPDISSRNVLVSIAQYIRNRGIPDTEHQAAMNTPTAVTLRFCSTIQGSVLTYWGRDKMAAIFQTTFSKLFFMNENSWISIKMSLVFVHRGPINNIPALVQTMAWHRPGDKPLSDIKTIISR